MGLLAFLTLVALALIVLAAIRTHHIVTRLRHESAVRMANMFDEAARLTNSHASKGFKP